MPMLREKGEVQLEGAFTGSSYRTEGFDGQAAVAVTDHVGVVGAYSYAQAPLKDCSKAPPGHCDLHRHHFGEVGIGYTTRVGRDWFGVNAYGGYGYGWVEAFGEHQFFGLQERTVASGWYGRFYLQPGLFIDVGPIQYGIAYRITRVRFHQIETTQSDWDTDEGTVFLEPTITLRAGFDSVMFVSQWGIVGSLEDPPYPYAATYGGLGIRLRLNEIFWDRSEER